jgi:hypothetical protein
VGLTKIVLEVEGILEEETTYSSLVLSVLGSFGLTTYGLVSHQ